MPNVCPPIQELPLQLAAEGAVSKLFGLLQGLMLTFPSQLTLTRHVKEASAGKLVRTLAALREQKEQDAA